MIDRSAVPSTRAAVLAHVEAFNDHDTERVLAGLAEQVVWATGADVYRSRESLREVFDAWLWSLCPRLDIARLLLDGDDAAMECVEHMVVDGRAVEFPIAVFCAVRDGLLTTVRVYREGSATIS